MKAILDFFVKNYKPLLTSFVLAVLLWVVVTTDKVYNTRIEVPLKIVRLAKNRVLLNPVPEKVVLEVRGKGRALIGLNFFNTAFKLELPEADHSLTIDLMDYKNSFNIPREMNITVVDIIEPKKLKLEIDKYSEEYKPIKLISEVIPSAGYILMDVKPERDSVLLSGPQSIVEQVEYISNESYNRKDVKYPFTEKIKLVEPKPGITRLDPETIEVTFVIEQLVERSVYNIPIQMVGIPDNLIASAIPPAVSLRVKGGESLVSALKADEITVLFNYARDYQQGRVQYPMQVETPPGISVVEMSPSLFRLQLKKKETKK
ncbi:MAG TPA: YbbR-like domain-containing protein [Caldithrix abyssi]|uniref:YbbR-like domain-containing protein n=1 Tax=Caldithrix abyssi TaxID=187145 RepID=A0A7V4WWD5_CALAY|nr:YbbR-like domain-containing protein [Caldithrix abyssi]